MIARRAEIGAKLVAATQGDAARLGLKLLSVEVQELGRTSGSTIVLGFPAGAAPLPLRSDPGAGEIESSMPEDQ